MELKINNKTTSDNNSLFTTEYISSEPFVAQADQEYKKYVTENRKRLIEEINRRNIEGSYDV